jgi:hypothetical protein
MHIRFLLLGAAASLLFSTTSFADPPPVPRAAKVVPPAASSVTPVKTPMPAATAVTPLSKVSLNPQPLPPKIGPDPVLKVPGAQSKAKTSGTPSANAAAAAQQP